MQMIIQDIKNTSFTKYIFAINYINE